MFDFSNQVALVTGAAGALGRVVAQSFLNAGAKLVLVDISDDKLREVHADLLDRDDVAFVATNLIDEDSITEMAARAKAVFGRVDVLANIAGGFRMGPKVADTHMADWDLMMDMNARSMFLASRAVLPMMVSQEFGKIVSVSARVAAAGKGQMAPYCASKAAVVTMTESMAAEYRKDGININCILPGTIDTPANRADMPNADFSTWVPPQQLADVIMFLASDAAVGVHGAAVPVYGLS